MVYPGEKINIRYSGTDSLQMYIQGNTKRTNELDFFRKLVQKTGNVSYFLPSMPYQRKVDNLEKIHDLEKTIHILKNNRLQFLTLYTKQFPVSNSFIKIAVHCIKSTAIRDSLLLYHNNREMLIKQNLYRQFATAKVASLNHIGFMPYPMYYQACVDLVSMAVGTSRFDIDGIGNNSSDFVKSFDFIEKNFAGLPKSFLMAKALYSGNINKVPISKSYLNKFNTQCQNKGYLDLVHKKLNDNSKSFAYAKGSNKLLAMDGKTVQDLSAVISKHKGKLILFDFWASWCSPCRQEMPSATLLKKKYKGRNIAFVIISTDAEVNDWQKAAKEESLESDNNFLLLNADQASFVKRYNINSIPRYILIGKDGKVLSEDAPRPSDQKLKELINQYL